MRLREDLGSSRSARRGFTLIEMMIVVAIVGILAALAVVAYRKYILSAHTTEATHMVQSIRVAQDAYHAETQSYVSTSTDGITGRYPTQNNTPGPFKSNWVTPNPPNPNAPCLSPGTGTPSCFGLLAVHADGPVAYGYATVGGNAGNYVNKISLPSGTMIPGPATTSGADWFWVTAVGNLANDPNAANWSYVVGNSFSNELFVQDQ
jgi:type IV pilus assembly protein PilA